MKETTKTAMVMLLIDLYQRKLRKKYSLDKAAHYVINELRIVSILATLRGIIAYEGEQNVVNVFCNEGFNVPRPTAGNDMTIVTITRDEDAFFEAANELNVMLGYAAVAEDGSCDPEFNIKDMVLNYNEGKE